MTAPTWQSADQQSKVPPYQSDRCEQQQGQRSNPETQIYRHNDQNYNRGYNRGPPRRSMQPSFYSGSGELMRGGFNRNGGQNANSSQNSQPGCTRCQNPNRCQPGERRAAAAYSYAYGMLSHFSSRCKNIPMY